MSNDAFDSIVRIFVLEEHGITTRKAVKSIFTRHQASSLAAHLAVVAREFGIPSNSSFTLSYVDRHHDIISVCSDDGLAVAGVDHEGAHLTILVRLNSRTVARDYHVCPIQCYRIVGQRLLVPTCICTPSLINCTVARRAPATFRITVTVLASFLLLALIGLSFGHYTVGMTSSSSAKQVVIPANRIIRNPTHTLLPRYRPVRRLGGNGCDMTKCSNESIHFVGGIPGQPWPHLYLIVPFRNRLSSLARLVSSLNSALHRSLRACTCIVLSDYDTQLSALPAWQNPSCIATFNAKYKMYMQENDYDAYGRRLEVRVLIFTDLHAHTLASSYVG